MTSRNTHADGSAAARRTEPANLTSGPGIPADNVVYDAFVSYSHTKDKALASAFQSIVQKIGKPWYRRRALRLFRDETSLSAGPQLWAMIEQRLAQSRFLILFGSEEAAASPWVGKEVTWWLDHRGSETILIALTSGELEWVAAIGDFCWSETTPLPQALKGRFSQEPRWVDLRSFRDDLSTTDQKFMAAGADFAAAMHGRPKEDLLSEEVRQQRLALRLAGSAVISLVAFLVIAGWQWVKAETERMKAERNSTAAQGAAHALVFDMAKDIRNNIGIPQTLVERMLRRATQVLEDLAKTSPDEQSVIELQTNGLIEFGKTLEARQLPDQALSLYTQCREILEPRVGGSGAKAVYLANIAGCNDRAGRLLLSRGDLAGAEEAFRAGNRFIERAMADNISSSSLQLIFARIQAGLGQVQLRRGEVPGALDYFRGSRKAASSIAEAQPDNLEIQVALYDALHSLGDAFRAGGQLDDALSSYRDANTIIARLAEKNGENFELKSNLATSIELEGEVSESKGDFHAALDAYRRANELRERVAIAKEDLIEEQYKLANTRFNVGHMLLMLSDTFEASLILRGIIPIAETLVNSNAESIKYKDLFYKIYMNLGNVRQRMGSIKIALEYYHDSIDISQSLSKLDPNNVKWRLSYIESSRAAAAMLIEQRKLEEAIKTYQVSLAGTNPSDAYLGNKDLQNAMFLSEVELGHLLLKAGRIQEARREALAALTLARSIGAGEDIERAEALMRKTDVSQTGQKK